MFPRRLFWLCCVVGLIGATTYGKEQLNLLIITADDMNGDSWFNSKTPCTPTLDAFARTCYRFEQQHVSAPICQPSRSALMTGRVPHRNGALGFNPINLDVPTLTEVMASNGYFTAAINKTMHMAPESKFKWDVRLEGSGKNPDAMRDQFANCLKAATEQKKPFFINANITDPHRPFAGTRGADAEEGEGAKAGGKGKKRALKNEAASAPVKLFETNEITLPPFLDDIPGVRSEAAHYFSSVRRLDATFASIMSDLKAAGHDNDTVIVFMSDHGMSFPFSKATLYYNGTWSPVCFCWPGLKKPFNNRTDMVSSVDVMPTVLDLLHIKAPAGMDGRSLVPIMNGRTLPDTDHVFTHVNTVSSGKAFPGRCVRTLKRSYIWNSWPDGKTRYKIEAMGGMSFAAMQQWGEHDSQMKERVNFWLYRVPDEFYDLEKDPTEKQNLINHPAYQSEIAKFRKLLLEHMQQTDDPLIAQFKPLVK